MWRGQEKGAARIGNTGKPFDEPTTQKSPALRVALRRAPAASPRSTVLPDTLFARLLADRLAGTQRSRFNLATTCSQGADHFRALFRFPSMPYVQSSALEWVTYDEEAHTLCATFRESHRTFVYEEVPQEVYDALIFADSLGSYFNAHIRGHFPYREIREN